MAIATGDKVRLFALTRAEGERGSIGRNGSVLTVLEADEAGFTHEVTLVAESVPQ